MVITIRRHYILRIKLLYWTLAHIVPYSLQTLFHTITVLRISTCIIPLNVQTCQRVRLRSSRVFQKLRLTVVVTSWMNDRFLTLVNKTRRRRSTDSVVFSTALMIITETSIFLSPIENLVIPEFFDLIVTNACNLIWDIIIIQLLRRAGSSARQRLLVKIRIRRAVSILINDL